LTVGGNMKLPPSELVLRFSFFLVDGATEGAFFSLAMIFCLCPSRVVGAAEGRASENQFLFRWLEIVVVPELAPGDDLLDVLDAVGCRQAVHLQLAGQPGDIEIGHLTRPRIDAEAL